MHNKGLTLAALLWLLASAVAIATAASFSIVSISTRIDAQQLLLNAHVEFKLSPAMIDALNNSVPLTLVLRIQVLKPRPLIWDKVISEREQRLRLEYHALVEKYLLTDLNSGVQQSFLNRLATVSYSGRLRDIPVIAEQQLQQGCDHYARMQLALDIEALPAPLRPVAYLSSDWRLSNDWYTWDLGLAL